MERGKLMKLFLSWSKDESKQYANVFKEELPTLFPNTEIFMSDTDISMGSFSIPTIMQELENSTYGILFITPDNKDEPWINFEAGALSKGLSDMHVTPIGFRGIEMEYLSSPIKNYQGFLFEELKFKKTMNEINRLTDTPLPKKTFDVLLNSVWESLSDKIEKITDDYKIDKKSKEDPVEGKLNLILSELTKMNRNKNKKYTIYTTSEIRKFLPEFDSFINENEELFLTGHVDSYFETKEDVRKILQPFMNYIDTCKNIKIKGEDKNISSYLLFDIFLTYLVTIQVISTEDRDMQDDDLPF